MNEDELRQYFIKQLDAYKAEQEQINMAYKDNLQRVYEDSVEDLTNDYKEYVGKVGIISGLVGILVGMGLATLIEVIFE